MVNVDGCEKKPHIAKELHYQTTKLIANHIDKSSGKLIYISTDSLFNGKKNSLYTEKDATNPLNVYARTKLLGESPVLQMKNGTVVRTNIIGCTEGNKPSFSDWIINCLEGKQMIKLFDNVMFSPLHVSDLSNIIYKIINNDAVGIYNAGSLSPISKYEFGLTLANIFDFENKYIERSCSTCAKLIADRPNNMGLSSKKLSLLLNEKMPTVERGIQLLKDQYVNNKNR
jgi:dTDP-4-dehydrorhamnose reductase